MFGSGNPNFGTPSSTSAAIAVPSGEAGASPLVANASFDWQATWSQNFTGWGTWCGMSGTHCDADFSEPTNGTVNGASHGSHWKGSAYEVSTYQLIKDLPNGTYKVTGQFKSTEQQQDEVAALHQAEQSKANVAVNDWASHSFRLVIDEKPTSPGVGFFACAACPRSRRSPACSCNCCQVVLIFEG